MDSLESCRSTLSIPAAAAGRVGGVDRDPYQQEPEMPEVLIVLAVEKRPRRRLVTLGASGEALVQVLVSPPAPPTFAIAVLSTFDLQWFDLRVGEKGKNLTWQRIHLQS
jgi:hypothetical protein